MDIYKTGSKQEAHYPSYFTNKSIYQKQAKLPHYSLQTTRQLSIKAISVHFVSTVHLKELKKN
jgi:hypothetical protein